MIISFDNQIIKGADTKSNLRKVELCASTCSGYFEGNHLTHLLTVLEKTQL